MDLKSWMKNNETVLKIVSILLIVFALWMAFSPATPARASIGNWFGGLNTVFLLMVVGGILIATVGKMTGPGIIVAVIGGLMFYTLGLLQNIFATIDPIILIVVGAAVVWYIMISRRR